MGMDKEQVKYFIEGKSIHEENPDLVKDYMNKPKFENALKINFEKQRDRDGTVQASVHLQ